MCLYHVHNTVKAIQCYLSICIPASHTFLFFPKNSSELSALKYLSYCATVHCNTSFHLCVCEISVLVVHLVLQRF